MLVVVLSLFTGLKSEVSLQDADYCTEESARLFRTIISQGYEIFQPGWPLTKLSGCANKFWTEDLLLVRRDFLLEFIRDHAGISNTSQTGRQDEVKLQIQTGWKRSSPCYNHYLLSFIS